MFISDKTIKCILLEDEVNESYSVFKYRYVCDLALANLLRIFFTLC